MVNLTTHTPFYVDSHSLENLTIAAFEILGVVDAEADMELANYCHSLIENPKLSEDDRKVLKNRIKFMRGNITSVVSEMRHAGKSLEEVREKVKFLREDLRSRVGEFDKGSKDWHEARKIEASAIEVFDATLSGLEFRRGHQLSVMP